MIKTLTGIELNKAEELSRATGIDFRVCLDIIAKQLAEPAKAGFIIDSED